jgi:hypothetical protein
VPTDAAAYAFAAAQGSRSGTQSDAFAWCTKDSLSAARSCALSECRKSGGHNCAVVSSCSNAKWSGVAEVGFTSDIMRHGAVCGKPTQPAIRSSMVDKCKAIRKSIRPKAETCEATIVTPSENTLEARYQWEWVDGQMMAVKD